MRDEKPQLIDEAEMRSSTRKVLIVDEDIQDLSSHAMLFEAQSCMVYKCSSYGPALRSVEKEDFDLAVVNFNRSLRPPLDPKFLRIHNIRSVPHPNTLEIFHKLANRPGSHPSTSREEEEGHPRGERLGRD